MLSLLICSVDGAGERDVEVVGGGDCWDDGPRRCRISNNFFSDTVLHLRVRNISVHPTRASVALVAHSSTCDVTSTYGIGGTL